MFSLGSLFRWIHKPAPAPKPKPAPRRYELPLAYFETLERRDVFSGTPLPVLMVIADDHHFYYKEYGDTRLSLEAEGLDVVVAARTTNPSTPHAGSGEPATGGVVTPDIALANVNPDDYSAIVFVGGWGSSMYQYAFEGTYANAHYNGDLATKEIVNNLINDFVDQDKHVAAICHATTILAWARVDGVSPLAGKQVSVPYIGSPAVEYNGIDYADFALMQYEQVVANGAIANTVSGQYGVGGTVADDVVVDGRIITAENYDTALEFGRIVALEVIAAANEVPPEPANNAPALAGSTFVIAENSAAGSQVGVVVGSDSDAGQTLTYSFVSGNDSGAFAIDATTGQIVVANPAALNYELTSTFELIVQVADSGAPSLATSALFTIELQDVDETPVPGIYRVADDLRVQGTSGADTVYLWTDYYGRVFAWLNGVPSGPHTLGPAGRVVVYSGEGNDQVFANDLKCAATLYGEGGHDLLHGGSAGDLIDGGAGVDRIWGNEGDDVLLGGEGNDILVGRTGNDVIVGGAGDDGLYGQDGRDVLIGGLGSDHIDGGADEDLLIGGTTSYDAHAASLLALLSEWTQPIAIGNRIANLQAGINGISLNMGSTIHDDSAVDSLVGGLGDDWI